MSILASDVAVVWQVAKHGVYHVEASTMKLENMMPDIGGLPFHCGGIAAAAIIGDTVLVFGRKTKYNKTRGNYEIDFQRVLRLRRDEKPVVFVQTGRRPKLSELDTEDTELTMVTAHDGKFRIFGNAEPAFFRRGIKMVDFDSNGSPVNDSLVTDQQMIERAKMRALIDKLSVLAHGKSWSLKDGGKLSSGGKSGLLEINRNGQKSHLPISLPLPAGLDTTFIANSFDENGHPTNEQGEFGIDEFASTHCSPVIVYQNGDVLGIMIQWRGFHRGLFPVIWQVKESELFPKSN